MRVERRATSTAAGIVSTPARPKTIESQARALLLLVGPSTRGGRNRAADHSGDRDQREDVRQRLEERPRRLAVRRRKLDEGERACEAEQQRRSERTEWTPVAEDHRGEGDEAAAAGHRLRSDLVEGMHVS